MVNLWMRERERERERERWGVLEELIARESVV